MPLLLSDAARERLNAMFAPADRDRAERLLIERCGKGLPFHESTEPEKLDRFRFAALKLSKGTIEGLESAVRLANIDWRDLLVFAGFADDVEAHRHWWPNEEHR